jgi:hypothetical protein
MKYSVGEKWPDKNSEIAIEYSKLKLFKLVEPHRELHWDTYSLELRCQCSSTEELIKLLPLLGYDPVILPNNNQPDLVSENNYKILNLSEGFQKRVLNPGHIVLHGVQAYLTFGETGVVVSTSSSSYCVELHHVIAAQQLESIYLQYPEVVKTCM